MIIWTTNEADYPDHSFLYVSKLGSDANAGTKTAPLLTINAAIAIAEAGAGYVTEKIAIVIGEGIWTDVINTARIKVYKFIGETNVLMDGVLSRINMKQAEWIINLELKNYESIGIATNTTSGGDYYFKNVVADEIYQAGMMQSIPRFHFYGCVIEKIRMAPTDYQRPTLIIENCIIGILQVTASDSQNLSVYNTIFKHEIILSHPFTSITYIDFNNFVENKIIVADVEYNTLSYDPFIILSRNANSISADPEFNNETLGDYSLKETSPCLLAGLNRVSIGAYNRGWPHYSFTDIFRVIFGAVYSESYVGVTLERDIVADLEEGSFELESGHNTGTVVSAVGNLGAPQRIDRIESLIDFGTDVNGYHTNLPVWSDFLFAAYNNSKKYFEGDTITDGGIKYICIQNYPNENPFVEYPPASSPTYWAVSTIPTATNVVPNFLFRYGNLLAEVNAADWKLMPFKGAFLVDENGKGSADPDYDAATGRYLTFSRYQFKLKLKNL